ncbi:MAG: excinuclease ABC subunit C [Paludibacteraceae bacterium]|nr:excinuclease ABC subunit C [Paludibacteraceae bacterium]
MSDRTTYLKNIVLNLPESPGVYQYFNNENEIIYVGKAKNLKRRVSSYFNKNNQSSKVRALVAKICDIKYIVVNSEADALLLENNLIKQYQPHYNILLKDGKTYPWLCITKEPYPKVFKTRVVKRGAEYFGPYSSVWVLDTLLDLIRSVYPIRTCNLALNQENIGKNKFKVCLQYHIHRCLGPCENLQDCESYQQMINEIKEIVKGNSDIITAKLVDEMQSYASKLQFEKAAELKRKFDALTNYQKKTVITTTNHENIDVFGYFEEDDLCYINIMRIANGSIIQGTTVEYKKQLDEPASEILAVGIKELRERFASNNKQIVAPFEPEYIPEGTEIIIPQKGDKKKLLDLSIQNVKQYRLDKLKRSENINAGQRNTKLLLEIKDKLGLPKVPYCIDSFDNSHTAGTNAVSACVVYRNGKPSKKDYRKYNIKFAQGGDDYGSMREVVYRRYSRMIEEDTPLPDLIVADGGENQMSCIKQIVTDELGLEIPIIGLAKNDKHRTHEILVGNPVQVVSLKTGDPLFKFFANMQEEVHRFAISFHRDKRSKSQIASELDEIKGIGEKTKNDLLKSLKSVKNIRNAEKSELEKIVGTKRASIVYEHFSRLRKSEN